MTEDKSAEGRTRSSAEGDAKSIDRIEKTVTLKAPRDRVWNAISDAKNFGAWFGCELDGPFVAGKPVTGRIVPTQVDPEIAALQEPHRGLAFEWHVERIEPQTVFAFRWHPNAVDPGVDYSNQPTTLVTFELSDDPTGTRLRITESDFDRIPLDRRAKAFTSNEGGWEKQTELIGKFLAR
ncbi:MAG: SRPBCC family protein [Kofleriaceae bacterium]